MGWFEPQSCFSKVGSNGYTAGYCTGNLLILAVAILILIAVIAILYWQLKDGVWKKKKTWKKSKTWIFLLLALNEFMVVIRYTIEFYETDAY